MSARGRATVKDTAKTRNIGVRMGDEITLDEMEAALDEVAATMSLRISHITRLGTKRYPGNRHWHLKQEAGTTGCLDVTYWPQAPLLWISIRNHEPAWVHDDGELLASLLGSRLDAGVNG
jgi:hypothetical protein